MAELSRRSGVPVATIKYYIREGLLPAGDRTAPTQAEYGEHTLRRLRLARALICLGGLSVAEAADVLSAIDERGTTPSAAAAARSTVPPAVAAHPPPEDTYLTEARALCDAAGWTTPPDSPHLRSLATAQQVLNTLGATWTAQELLPYARLAHATARIDLARIDLDREAPPAPALTAAEHAVIQTVLLEPVLATLRRLAQDHEEATRTDREDGPTQARPLRPTA
ncbi:MerR family transcriptional regulator [Streptomyces sp. G45]|uniref:MerR family transcriptional regulator n=1 Tax=Streptomyces sp. G45 TaxID=3406627 RepID=UPI003C236B86